MPAVQRRKFKLAVSDQATEVASDPSRTKSIHGRHGPLKPAATGCRQKTVCKYYLNGNCKRYNCPYLHIRSLEAISNGVVSGPQQVFVNNWMPGYTGQTAHLKWVRDRRTIDENVAPQTSTFPATASKIPGAPISTSKTPAAPTSASKVSPAPSGTLETSPAPAITSKTPAPPVSASRTPAPPISTLKVPTTPAVALETCPTPAIAFKTPVAHAGSTKISLTQANTATTPEACDTVSNIPTATAFQNFNKVCNQWMEENCSAGERCRYLHSWSVGEDYTYLASLEGHLKSISGIALPKASNKLYTGSKDESVRIWDCHTGKCAGVINLGGEVGCLISEGPWIFVGIPNLVKAWNIQTSADISLSGPVGQVYALNVGNDILFAGTQDGSILAWRSNAAGNCFEEPTSLTGHHLAVVSLFVGAGRLYSGSMDHRIKVWDLDNLQCLRTLTDHTSAVMSVLFWDKYLLSCSLDNTIKVWAMTEGETLEVIYTHSEKHSVLSLCGMHDSKETPVLMCSCDDNAVRLYDLPSFSERGRIFAKREILSMQAGPGGLFFTGDGTGLLKVWRWLSKEGAPASTLP